MNKKDILVSLKNTSITYNNRGKSFKAVDRVSFDIYKGETFSLVGESGSGKTTIGRAIMKIVPTSNGDIIYKGNKIDKKMTKEEIRTYKQNVQMIFQDPMASLNERAKVDYIVSEGLYNFKLFDSEKDRYQKVEEALLDVGLIPEFASRFPHEFSGGQRQRIGIARALVMNPTFVVADEPISALDVSIRAQVINLLNELKDKKDLTYLFIAHDLSVVRFISDRIGVIYAGKIVELCEAERLFENPVHPYTKSLLSAVPIPNPKKEKAKVIIDYNPSMHDYSKDTPCLWTEIEPGHFVLASKTELNNWLKKK
jgi:oligopeptide transport system ATP-binding protein